MKREEKEVKLRMILTDYHRRDDYELRRAVNDILALDALPSAEGAEDGMMFTISEDGINPLDDEPTAAGAEEIAYKYMIRDEDDTDTDVVFIDDVIKAMQEFATLHAQKLADKMVSERWINVKDRLPRKDGKSSIYCLVNSEYDGIVMRPYNEYHKCWDTEDADDYYCDAVGGKITHWMPLPNPPIK